MAVWPRMAEMYNYVLMIISILEISEDVWQVNNNRIKKKRENEKKKRKVKQILSPKLSFENSGIDSGK